MYLQSAFGQGQGSPNGLMSPGMDPANLAALMAMEAQKPRSNAPQIPDGAKMSNGAGPQASPSLAPPIPTPQQSGGIGEMLGQLGMMDPEKRKQMMEQLGLGGGLKSFFGSIGDTLGLNSIFGTNIIPGMGMGGPPGPGTGGSY